MAIHEAVAHRLAFPMKLAKWATLVGAVAAQCWSTEYIQERVPEEEPEPYEFGGYL